MSREPERATIDDLAAVAAEPREFWGDRELPAAAVEEATGLSN
jgi:hypothetical protein